MSKYLASIAAFFTFTTFGVVAVAFPAQPSHLMQETQAPSASPQQSQSESAPATPAAEPKSKSESASPAKTPAAQTKKSKKKHHAKPAAATPATDPSAAPEKKVVRNGGTVDPAVQLAPGMSADQASSQRQNTTQLLAASDANLKQISSRPLNPSEQDSASQVRKYMEQAKAAEKAGDVERAHNLASKALLLSDDLVKH